MIVQGNLYSLNGQNFLVSGYTWDGIQLKIVCNNIIPNSYDKEERYFSYTNDDFRILDSQEQFSILEFQQAKLLNKRCLNCSFYDSHPIVNRYKAYSTEILESLFSKEQFESMSPFYISSCAIRDGFCQTLKGIPDQEFPAIIHFTNCQFKTTKKLFNLADPCEPFHEVTTVNLKEAEKFVSIIKSNFTQFLEGNGAVSRYKTIKLSHSILSPYQIDFLRSQTPRETKIYFSDMLSAELICKNIKELEDCYLFYCYAKDLTVENYYSYIASGDSVMLTENEEWFVAMEEVESSRYLNNYFFTAKDNSLLEKFSKIFV